MSEKQTIIATDVQTMVDIVAKLVPTGLTFEVVEIIGRTGNVNGWHIVFTGGY